MDSPLLYGARRWKCSWARWQFFMTACLMIFGFYLFYWLFEKSGIVHYPGIQQDETALSLQCGERIILNEDVLEFGKVCNDARDVFMLTCQDRREGTRIIVSSIILAGPNSPQSCLKMEQKANTYCSSNVKNNQCTLVERHFVREGTTLPRDTTVSIEYYCSYGEKSTSSSKVLQKEASLKDIKYDDPKGDVEAFAHENIAQHQTNPGDSKSKKPEIWDDAKESKQQAKASWDDNKKV